MIRKKSNSYRVQGNLHQWDYWMMMKKKSRNLHKIALIHPLCLKLVWRDVKLYQTSLKDFSIRLSSKLFWITLVMQEIQSRKDFELQLILFQTRCKWAEKHSEEVCGEDLLWLLFSSYSLFKAYLWLYFRRRASILISLLECSHFFLRSLWDAILMPRQKPLKMASLVTSLPPCSILVILLRQPSCLLASLAVCISQR